MIDVNLLTLVNDICRFAPMATESNMNSTAKVGSARTSGPWRLSDDRTISSQAGAPVAKLSSSYLPQAFADGHFIVTTCNAHDELVAALRQMLDVCIDGEWGTPAHAKAEREARAALAKIQP